MINIEKIIKGGVTGVKDIIDDRDYPYEYLFGGNTQIDFNGLKEKIIDLPNDYQNQNLQEISYYMCVAYSTVHGDNIMNNIDNNIDRYYGLELGMRMYELGRLNLKEGALLSAGPKTMIELGKVNGTALISTIGGYIDSINNNRTVILGTDGINWNKTSNSFYAIKGKSYGHCFLGIGYNKNGIICKNTLGKKWGLMGGKFIIKWEDFNLLFNSKISLINNDIDIFKQIRDRKAEIRLKSINNPKYNIYRDGTTEYLSSIKDKNSIEYKINRIAILSLLGMKNLVKECLK